ncbi:unnamed protein product [Tilletia controversa]|nr:unnamed protein product [Tilletia controversa]
MQNDLKVLQYNCHNEPEVIAALLNHPLARKVDILCLQEPYTYYTTPVSHPDWTVFGRSGPLPPEAWGNFPREQAQAARPRVLTYVNNKRLNIANISLVGIEHPDLISVQLRLPENDAGGDEEQATNPSELVVTNIYNPCRSADTVPPLLHSFNIIRSDHHLLVGDFNSHHPLWQSNVYSISRHAESIITATQALHLELVTPLDTPTFHYGGRRALSSTIDLCFATEELRDRVVRCEVGHELDTGSDHAPVLTTLDVSPITATASGRFNMRKCNSQRLVVETRKAWESALTTLPPLDSKESVASWAEAVQRAMITSLEKSTPRARPSPRSQEWYDEGIKHLGSLCNSARRHWQKQRTEDTRNFYVYLRNTLKSTVRSSKRQQRKVALAQADGRSLWKLAKAGRAAGGVGIVSTLRDADGSPVTAPTEKEEILRRGFWGGVSNPSSPETHADDDHFTVSSATAEAAWADFTAEEVRVSLQRSAKNTAPVPDQIPWEVLIHLSRGWSDFNDVLARLYSASIRGGLVGATDQERQSMSIGWVDDWTTAVSSPDYDDLQRRLQGVCDLASDWATAHKSQFDQEKTKVCIMPSKKAQPPRPVDVRLHGTAVQAASSVKVLGVTLQSDLKYHTHVNDTVRKATAAAGSLMSWGNLQTTYPSQLHVYTDGSGHDGRFGAAVHFRGGDSATRPQDIQVGLGRMSTVYRSEATAMRAAL